MLISIVTPSYNMGRFLGEAIDTVLSQDYPHVEYIVVDGGSTDASVSILERCAGRLQYTSGPDAGAADAIRLGFERARGEVLAYLNADDAYVPGAVSAAVRAFKTTPDVDIVYGDAVWIDEAGAELGSYPTRDFDAGELISECFICQPAAFMRRSAYDAVGGIDPNLQLTFDYDLWLRMARQHHFLHIPQLLARSRMHRANKTIGSRRRVLRETIEAVRASAGYAPFGHVYAYACHLVDGRDQFFEPMQGGMLKMGLTLPLGLWFSGPRPGPFVREYLSACSRRNHSTRSPDSRL